MEIPLQTRSPTKAYEFVTPTSLATRGPMIQANWNAPLPGSKTAFGAKIKLQYSHACGTDVDRVSNNHKRTKFARN